MASASSSDDGKGKSSPAPDAAKAADPPSSRLFGVMFGLYVVLTPFVAVWLLMFPALVLLIPGLPSPALRLALFRRWIGAVMTAWLRLPAALLEFGGFGSAPTHLRVILSGAYAPPPMATSGPGAAESFVAIANHPSRIDWLVLWAWWSRHASLAHQKIALKRGLAMIPGSGWAMQLASFLFLKRAWADDQQYMNQWIDTFFGAGGSTGGSDPAPCQLLLFPEGTNLTEETRGIDNKFVAKSGGALQPYTHVLHPRTTGFVHLIKQIRASAPPTRRPAIDAVYDITIAYPDGRGWTEVDLVKGRCPSEAHFHFARYALSDLPESDTDLANWCNARFAEKEQRLAAFRASQGSAPHIPSGYSFAGDAAAEAKVAPVPTLSYAASLAFWTGAVVLYAWLCWCCAPVRWYTLLVSVGAFLYCKYQPGLDHTLLRWMRLAAGASAGADKRNH